MNDDGFGDYASGSADSELLRLQHLSRLYRPATLAWLTQAGLEPGMRVVDLGCGLGDVTELAADLVGRDGIVTGVDTAARPLELARQRAQLDIGLRLAAVFESAGLRVKQLAAYSPIERGGTAVGYAGHGRRRDQSPPTHGKGSGFVTAREVAPDTFERRVRAKPPAETRS